MARRPDVRYINFYTEGSAARKVAPVEPLKVLQPPRVRKRKRIVLHVDPVATVGIIVSAVMLILMAVGVAQLKAVQQDAVAMASYVQTLQEENAALNATYESSYDLADVEKTALALGLVPKEQVTHITLTLPQYEEQGKPDVLERFYTFLTGLFA